MKVLQAAMLQCKTSKQLCNNVKHPSSYVTLQDIQAAM